MRWFQPAEQIQMKKNKPYYTSILNAFILLAVYITVIKEIWILALIAFDPVIHEQSFGLHIIFFFINLSFKFNHLLH